MNEPLSHENHSKKNQTVKVIIRNGVMAITFQRKKKKLVDLVLFFTFAPEEAKATRCAV